MNKHVHRLVFDRRRGMRVPAAEHVRSAGKAGSGESSARRPVAMACLMLSALGSGALLLPDVVEAQTRGVAVPASRSMAGGVRRVVNESAKRAILHLPVRSTALERLKQDLGQFEVIEGSPEERKMLIKQGDRRVIINWDSFDVGAGYTVEFQQPTSGAALNNIWSGDPSVILGSIKANGEVILQNRNGILFGPTARVDTGRFVAAVLSLSKDNFEKGLRAVRNGEASFGSDTENADGFITVERGAEIKSVAGGDVIMVAPKVYNEGRIETPSGQAILAAGQKVYLYSNSQDAAQKGLMVAVDAFAPDASKEGLNTVEQAAAGSYQVDQAGKTVVGAPSGTAGLVQKINQVIADKGTINLVGMTVRQNGVLSATTAVKGQNGAIFLQAMKSTQRFETPQSAYRRAKEQGTVDLGEGSITSVTPHASADTQTSSEAFYRSRINIDGKDIRVRSQALVQAVSGNIEIKAETTRSGNDDAKDDSTLMVDRGARITAAGLKDVALPMSRNQLTSTLFRFELADSAVQRDGPAYRKDVYTDARKPVSYANVRGSYNLIGRTAAELSVRGGDVLLQSRGTTVVADGAQIDISGGNVRYEPGQIYSSALGDGRRVVRMEDADPSERYTELFGPETPSATVNQIGSYVEGADAGSLAVFGSRYHFGGDVDASTVVGPLQRGRPAQSGLWRRGGRR
ncbi:MAG: filamentous hemagglutinin N-terminal domain-containing protein [Aquabacterium sp.]